MTRSGTFSRWLAAALSIAAVSVGAASRLPAASAQRSMALTFDDLPYVAADGRNGLEEAGRATASIVRVLAAHHAPALAFVNEGKLFVPGELDARVGLLQQWMAAGATLGNHTYSHADFNDVTVEQFEDEIVRGDAVIRRLQPAPTFFRFPETHTGDTEAKKQAVEQFLRARGYTIAPHTIDSSDFVFNVAFLRRQRAGNSADAERVQQAYVQFVMSATGFAERIAPAIFGREIPQTILLHANDINAESLDDILRRFEARGYRFISLAEAMSDAAYRTPDTLVTRAGPTWLWRWTKSLGQHVKFDDDPDPPDWVMALFQNK